MWFLSRLIIVIAMMLIAPLLPQPPGGIIPIPGWQVFSTWDSVFYERIVTSGYTYANDGKGHLVAFFPLLPLLIRALMTLGLPFEVAGTLVNNLAFLGALIVLYTWVEERHGIRAAQWATAVLAWCPFSIFGTVIYTEGLFLLFSTAALQAFDKQRYSGTAVWGALATATRPTGIALIPAFLIVTWREGRGIFAYLASLSAGGGLFLYSLYCGIQFGNPLAFAQVQQAWNRSFGVDWLGWWKILMQISLGPVNWKSGFIKDPWHPLLFLLICNLVYLLWRRREKINAIKVSYGFCLLGFLLWLLAGSPLINAVMVFGGGYLIWHLRGKISPVAVSFGFCALTLILTSGGTLSAERHAYGVITLALALGVLLAYYPRWGYILVGFFALLLTSFAVRFAQHLWVG